MISEKDLLVDCLERLNRSGIAYMLTGSMASNYWGIPRSTHDLDFVLMMTPADVPKLLAEFQQDFFLQPESVRGAFKPPFQFNALDERSALKIDFWILRDNAFERNAFNRRLKVEIFGTQAWVTTAEDIILHKLYWNTITPSERQLGDAAGVFAVQADSLDLNYLREWASRLQVTGELQDLLDGKIRPKST